MEYAIIGGDARFAHLAGLLRREGRGVRMFFRREDEISGAPVATPAELRCARNAVMNYPPKLNAEMLTYEEILDALPEDANIYLCGPGTPENIPGRRRIHNLWTDEALLMENAYLTAEGAVAAAMQTGACAIKDVECLVIGWGRIGRALTEILVGLRARVTVASRSEAGRNRAVERGAEVVATEKLSEALPGKRIVFSTPPCMVLDRETLRRADRDALIIDLASPPYGVDLRAAWNLGIRAWREPGLPGRYCPESAGRALMDALFRAEEKGSVGNA